MVEFTLFHIQSRYLFNKQIYSEKCLTLLTLYLFSRPWMWNLAIYNLCWNNFDGIYQLFEIQQPGQNCRGIIRTRVKSTKLKCMSNNFDF